MVPLTLKATRDVICADNIEEEKQRLFRAKQEQRLSWKKEESQKVCIHILCTVLIYVYHVFIYLYIYTCKHVYMRAMVAVFFLKRRISESIFLLMRF
jgi:hypothetical protein